MSSLEITLDEFVTEIPLCQVNTSWENIVNALSSSASDIIAIVDHNCCPRGILKSHHLLAAITDDIIFSEIAAPNIPESFSEALAPPQTTQLISLASPITTLSCQSKLKDLLAALKNQESPISEQNYLIVDARGKVQGILDLPKLINYIVQGCITVKPEIDRASFSHQLEEMRLNRQKTTLNLSEQIPWSLMWDDDKGNIQTTTQQPRNNLDQLAEVTEVPMPTIADLTKLNRLQNELMVNVFHDLKSPLTAIIGLSSLLREEKLGSLNSRQIRYLDLIYRGGRQLKGVVTDLLDITSLSTGKLRLKLESIELEKFCHQVHQQVVTKLEIIHDPHKNRPLVLPQFQFNLDPDASEIIADRLRLNQILTRLLENAIQSTPAEGEIGIRIESWDDNWLAIIVWDTGRGISEIMQPFLLEEMFEPDNFLTSSEKATSLGLILAQQLAQSHSGDLSFTSEINHGSEFTLLLPTNPLTLPSQEGLVFEETFTVISKNQQKSTLVLIFETFPDRIKALTKNLKKLGYHVVIARNSREALYKASHLKPSKIILNDEIITGTNQDILTQLKSAPQTSNIPLIVTCKNRPSSEYLYFQAEYLLWSSQEQINSELLAQYFPPLTSQNPNKTYCPGKRLTMLRLCLTNGKSSLTVSEIDFLFEDPSVNLCHHIIEADSIEQANMLARIWKIDTIIWDSSNLEVPFGHLRSLSSFPHLAQIPLVTLDESTTAAANQFENLNVFPCLVPINEQNITELMQVIQSAATAIDNG